MQYIRGPRKEWCGSRNLLYLKCRKSNCKNQGEDKRIVDNILKSASDLIRCKLNGRNKNHLETKSQLQSDSYRFNDYNTTKRRTWQLFIEVISVI
jgi:hypothetical protein